METKEQFKPVEKIAKGEYVKRKQDAKKVFIRGDYCPLMKAYSLIDTEDVNHQMSCKKGTQLFVGFIY